MNCVTRKELLAVIVALKNSHTYLIGQSVNLHTDNAAVSRMRSLKRPTGQVARWLQELGTDNLTIIHKPWKRHVNADAVSRMPWEKAVSNNKTTPMPIQTYQMRKKRYLCLLRKLWARGYPYLCNHKAARQWSVCQGTCLTWWMDLFWHSSEPNGGYWQLA